MGSNQPEHIPKAADPTLFLHLHTDVHINSGKPPAHSNTGLGFSCFSPVEAYTCMEVLGAGTNFKKSPLSLCCSNNTHK